MTRVFEGDEERAILKGLKGFHDENDPKAGKIPIRLSQLFLLKFHR
jgi:hypothetical protein